MGDHNDSFFSNILLENINNNIPLSADVLTPCKKLSKPNKKQTPSVSLKWKIELTPCKKLPNPNKKQAPPVSLEWKVILIKNTVK